MSRNPVQRTRSPARQAFWMRAVRFAGLHRVLHFVARYSDGIRVRDLNRGIVDNGLYKTDRGDPAKSTLYHCRNTLLHIGAVRRWRQRLVVATDDVSVDALLRDTTPSDETLSETARASFASLVLANRDCFQHFFRLFYPEYDSLDPEQFRGHANPVVWLRSRLGEPVRTVEIRSTVGAHSLTLSSPVEVQSILYGVRYWARDELRLIDEFFEVGRGSVMYPVRIQERPGASDRALQRILALPRDPGDWTTISVNGLLRALCEHEGYRVNTLFDAIRTLVSRTPGHVVLIPTIPNIAAISARSRPREAFELRAYFSDSRGPLISHIRFHNSLRGVTA